MVYKLKATYSWINWLGVGPAIRGSPVRFLAESLWSVFGQDSLLQIASFHPAVKRGPRIKGRMVV